MTIIEHNLRGLMEPWIGQKIGVRWTSMRVPAPVHAEGGGHRPARCEFVAAIELVDHDRALIEGWVESPGGREIVFRRRMVAVEVLQDAELLHIDAGTDALDGNSVSITVRRRTGAVDHDNLVYAQTSLLRKAGLAAGAHDPPSAFCIRD